MILLVSGIELIGKKRYIILVSAFFLMANIPTLYGIYTKNFNGAADEMAYYLDSKNKTGNPIITFDNSSFITLNYYLHQPSNLYFFSESKLPDCFSVNLFSNRVLNLAKLDEILTNIKSFWMVITPGTKEYPENYLKNILRLYSPDLISEKKFIYQDSWFRTKVVKYIENNNIAN
jgi:hypothetical protein